MQDFAVLNLSLSNQSILDAERHLQASCGVMARLIADHGHSPLAEREFRPFETLVTSIISQQLSAKAADTIKMRIRALVPDLDPQVFVSVPPGRLRIAGLSSSKIRYLGELARQVSTGQLNFEKLLNAPDDEVKEVLVKLPGIGIWTAEMFLIFGLHRPDVLSLGDAGLRRAVRLLFGEDARIEDVGEAWRPYRSVASWYLWRHLDA
jgi:DNA-3-methyladenine glycosylase II